MPALLSARRRARALASTDDGMTLMELMVAMVMASILGTMTLLVFLNVNTSTAATTDRVISTASARNALQSWTGYLQVADGTTPGINTNRIEWLTDTDMLFYADINNRTTSTPATTGPATMVWLRLDADQQLVEEQFSPTAVAGAAPTVCRILAERVSQAVGPDGNVRPIFAATDPNGAALTGLGTATTVPAGCQELPVTPPSQTPDPDEAVQAALVNIRTVTIDFQLRDGYDQHPIEFTSQAVLPNVGGGL